VDKFMRKTLYILEGFYVSLAKFTIRKIQILYDCQNHKNI